jgi:hypothetical protein
MSDGRVTDIEEFKASRMPPLRLGALEVEGSRIRLHADVALTPAAARTLAAQLLVMCEQIEASR